MSLIMSFDTGALDLTTGYLLLFLALLILNLVYLLFAPSQPKHAGRFSRLIGLWFNAKEAELRKRAGKSDH